MELIDEWAWRYSLCQEKEVTCLSYSSGVAEVPSACWTSLTEFTDETVDRDGARKNML